MRDAIFDYSDNYKESLFHAGMMNAVRYGGTKASCNYRSICKPGLTAPGKDQICYTSLDHLSDVALEVILHLCNMGGRREN